MGFSHWSRWHPISIIIKSPNCYDPLALQLGSKLFNVFSNDTGSGIEGTLSQPAADTELSDVGDTPEGHDANQRDLGKLNKWPMGTSWGSTRPEPGSGQPLVSIQAGDEQSEGSPAEKDLVVLAGERLHWVSNVPSKPRKTNVSWAAAKSP